ncbi:hypothetical protein Cni_G24615 [Canna indica]|uniref:HMA domain-containing protein n=1 Tax=Canna indica TaxID=4628 RepID=A0AAQ3KW35_9LILI|nr:hypothetical protein Cni_G24615 [Canna indica]
MAAPDQGCTETLKYQTLVLKVSIHCEGCRKQVKKILQCMEGVYRTAIDAQQHKVVVTGNVAAEVLIKKLVNAGKHAELWPQEKPNNEGGAGAGGKKSKNKNADVSNKPEHDALKDGGEESPPPTEEEDEVNKVPAAAGGGKKKKKEKKENNDDNSKNEAAAAAAGGTEAAAVPIQETNKKASGGGGGLAIPASFNFPIYAAAPQMPSYLLSYNSTQPTMSAYYSALPMLQSSYVYSPAPATAAPCSCYACNEENSNACSIM